MAKRPLLWQLHQMGKTYGKLPSEVLRLGSDNDWLSYQIDAACWLFGTWVDGKLAERTEPVKSGKKKGQTQPRYKLDDLLADPATQHERAQQQRQQRQHRSVRALLPPGKVTT